VLRFRACFFSSSQPGLEDLQSLSCLAIKVALVTGFRASGTVGLSLWAQKFGRLQVRGDRLD
jgi:hypothetical protein